jgi:hypothetical protein
MICKDELEECVYDLQNRGFCRIMVGDIYVGGLRCLED